MMRIKYVLTFLLISFVLEAQKGAQLSINHYTINDGLSQMQVMSMFKDQSDRLWIGTRGGLCTFDGKNFDDFKGIPNAPEIILDIKQLGNEQIVLLTPSKLVYFDGVQYINSEIDFSKRINYPTSLQIGIDDLIIINGKHQDNPLLIKDDRLLNPITYGGIEINQINSINISERNKANSTVLVNRKKIFTIKGDQKQLVFEGKKSILLMRDDYWCTVDQNNQIEVAFANHDRTEIFGVDYNQNVAQSLFKLNKVKNSIKVNPKLQASYIFYALENLYTIDSAKARNILSKFREKYNKYSSAIKIKDSYFIGTDKGLLEMYFTAFKTYSEDSYPYVWTINETKDDKLVFGSYGNGIYYYNNDESIQVKPYEHVPTYDFIYNGSCKDEHGVLYFPYSEGLLKLDDHQLSHFYPKSHIPQNPSLFAFYDKEKNHIIRACCPGIEIIDLNGKLIKRIDDPAILAKCVLTISKSDNGKYWIGGRGGVASINIDDYEIKSYPGSSEHLKLSNAICSVKDKKGRIIFGGNAGLAIYNKNNDSFESVKSLENHYITSLHIDSQSKLFAATTKGLLMFNLEEYDSSEQSQFRFFNNKNGLSGIELGQNGFYKDSKGLVWITSSTNLTSFNPSDLSYQSEVHFSAQVHKINDDRINLSNHKINLEKDNNSPLLEYGLLGYYLNHNVEYRHRLNSSSWSDWTERENHNFSNLASGKHQFDLQVKPQNSDIQDGLIYSSQFVIDVPFYKEPNFPIIALVLLSLAIIYSIYSFFKTKHEQAIINILEQEKEMLLFEVGELENINAVLKNDNKLKLANVTNKLGLASSQISSIEIKTGHKIQIVNLSEILYLRAEDNGTRIFINNNSYWTDNSMKEILNKLPQEQFLKIYRATIISIDKIEWVKHNSVMMNDGTELKVGRTYKKSILNRFTR